MLLAFDCRPTRSRQSSSAGDVHLDSEPVCRSRKSGGRPLNSVAEASRHPRARAKSVLAEALAAARRPSIFLPPVSTIAANLTSSLLCDESPMVHATVDSSNSNHMVAEPIVLWSAGPVKCVVVRSRAHSYQVQFVVRGRVFMRRWFERSEDAATCATELADQFGASHVDAASIRSAAWRAR